MVFFMKDSYTRVVVDYTNYRSKNAKSIILLNAVMHDDVDKVSELLISATTLEKMKMLRSIFSDTNNKIIRYPNAIEKIAIEHGNYEIINMIQIVEKDLLIREISGELLRNNDFFNSYGWSKSSFVSEDDLVSYSLKTLGDLNL